MVQATRRSRKQRTEAAIAHALARRWDQAARENRELLDQQPDDLEAANRLGKALTELGDVKAAIGAYQRSLEIDPGNAIARKNLVKLEAATSTGRAKDAKSRKPAAGDVIRTDALIDESGKSAVFGLHKPNRRALKRLSTGDPVQLQLSEHGVNVKSSTRAVLGHLDPRGAQRLHRLIEGGNRYEAAIRHIGDEGVTILVRETYRDPSLLDEPSFFPRRRPSAGVPRHAPTRAPRCCTAARGPSSTATKRRPTSPTSGGPAPQPPRPTSSSRPASARRARRTSSTTKTSMTRTPPTARTSSTTTSSVSRRPDRRRAKPTP